MLYYPDVVVGCESADDHKFYLTQPRLIAEVLSESTERIDRGEKLYNYRQITTLKNYLLIAQDRIHIDLYRRRGESWLHESYVRAKDVIDLDCPALAVRVSEIYDRVPGIDLESGD